MCQLDQAVLLPKTGHNLQNHQKWLRLNDFTFQLTGQSE